MRGGIQTFRAGRGLREWSFCSVFLRGGVALWAYLWAYRKALGTNRFYLIVFISVYP